MDRISAGRIGGFAKAKMIRCTYESNPKTCKWCKNHLPWDRRFNKFCSHSCSASHNNLGVRRHGSPPRACEHCGVETRNDRFCSNRCQREFEWKIAKEEIVRVGKLPPSSRVIRRYLESEFGHKCSVCHGTDWMGKPIPLEIDHINGNSEDNRIENLRMVCGNCAMQLPTYKNKNKGNGRWARRMRYKEGKSY